MQEKIIPQNISAEQNVLCAMLIDNKAVGTVSGTFTGRPTRSSTGPC